MLGGGHCRYEQLQAAPSVLEILLGRVWGADRFDDLAVLFFGTNGSHL